MILNAKTRAKEEKLDPKFIPAVVYGSGSDNQSLQLNKVEFDKLYKEAGESSLVELKIDDKDSVTILVKDTQLDPVKDTIIHADLYRVDMTKKVQTEISLNFIGQARAEKEQGAIIIKNSSSIDVECLPKDLVKEIDVDLAALVETGDAIYLRDVKLPADLEFLGEPGEVIVSAIEPRKEEEVVVDATEEGEEAAEGEEKKEDGEEKKEDGAKGEEKKEEK